MTRRESILATLKDQVGCIFFYYDRKEDEVLPVGSIEEAINAGEVTVDELVALCRTTIENALKGNV